MGPSGQSQKIGVMAFAPIWIAPIYSFLVVAMSGPTYTGAPEQGAMVVRFLGCIAFVGLSIILVAMALNQARGASQNVRSRMNAACFLSWCIGNVIVWMMTSSL